MCKYTAERIAGALDLASLKPDGTSVDTSICCQKAIRFNCASVCVRPYHVPIAARILADFNISVGTVIDFPHGSNPVFAKMEEARELIYKGADELDMVINIAAIKDGDYETVYEDIAGVVEVSKPHCVLVKVILETCYLKDTEIRDASIVAAQAGADFVKTSTGFGPGGATPEAVLIMREAVGNNCQVKASGGIHTYEDAERYLDLGCTRLGSSRVEELLPYVLE